MGSRRGSRRGNRRGSRTLYSNLDSLHAFRNKLELVDLHLSQAWEMIMDEPRCHRSSNNSDPSNYYVKQAQEEKEMRAAEERGEYISILPYAKLDKEQLVVPNY